MSLVFAFTFTMLSTFKILCFILSASCVNSSITGISYLDPLIKKPLDFPPGQNPCNPLYWYPQQIPDYCYKKIEEGSVKPKVAPVIPNVVPVPQPPPAPIPVPVPIPMPIFPSMPQFLPPPAPVFPIPVPQMPIPQMQPYGQPLPNQMLPILAPYPFPFPPIPPIPQQSGFVPGIPGIVSQDGGINILPFSDAYSDMLEKHKQKMIRRRLQKVLDDYDDYPRKHRKHKGSRYRY